MKANELMIGDWVKINYKGKSVKVKAIHDGLIDTTAVSPLMEDEYEPIPLTAEIIEKNGFVENDGSTSWKFETKRETLVTIYGVSEYHLSINIRDTHGYGKGFRWLLYNFTILYVHQLQQVLRVFGIDKTIEL